MSNVIRDVHVQAHEKIVLQIQQFVHENVVCLIHECVEFDVKYEYVEMLMCNQVP